jgi:precorrin-4/cobalt-precorrin-4 C11-methyltransferase
MKVHFVGAGPGDPELLTRKAERLLREARICVYAGSLVSPEVLALLPPSSDKYDSASMSLNEILAVCEGARVHGIDVVRLHSGEPSLYGAIAEQMDELDRRGIEYDVTPGISSFQAAAAALRTELTAPEIAQTVILTRASGRTPLPPGQELARLASAHATLCIFLSTGHVEEVAAALLPDYGPECPAAVVYHVTWPDQKLIRTRLADLASSVRAAGLQKTAIILVGEALARTDARSRLYDAAFTHEYRRAVHP